MAKDGTGRGGARPGAGRKPKALSEKIDNGNPGKRPLKTVKAEDDISKLEGVEMPEIKEYMKATQKDGSELLAEQIYKETWEWLRQYGCEKLVMPQLLEQFAMTSARLIHCEEQVSEYGYLAKRANGSAAASPYVTMSNEYRRQANQLYYEIYQIVKENSSVDVGELKSSNDMMENLLRSKKG